MTLTSLLVCRDAKTVQALTHFLLNLEIEVEHCSDPTIASASLSRWHFDVVLVDCQSEGSAMNFISQIHSEPKNRDTIVIALLDNQNSAREIFAKGAAFALYKPVSEDVGAAAIPSLARSERRLTPRIPVETNASIAYASTENEIIRVLDLSISGIAIHSAKSFPTGCKVYFQFSLPGEPDTIRLSCEVIWQNDSGSVGLRFADVPKASRRVLEYWIKNKVAGQLLVSHSLASKPSNDLRQRLVARLGLIAAPPSERREQARHRCTLGAQVSDARSTVPQRCVVSDISSGGCYIQTSEPMPVGTPIEIAIRTHELNLRIQGKVQSMHRSLGMGVTFSSQKLPEKLKQLISELQNQVTV
jgi:CheY-like chemotaxis protein